MKRMWLVLIGLTVGAAVVCALAHELVLLVWNMLWLGYYIYKYEHSEE